MEGGQERKLKDRGSVQWGTVARNGVVTPESIFSEPVTPVFYLDYFIGFADM